MTSKNTRGFTLIELLVVIAIIGILSSVVLASLNSARQKARDARRVADIKQVQLALELYFDANRNYPTPGAQFSSMETSGMISKIPADPLGGAYSYAALGAAAVCSSYHLGASLESSSAAALQTDVDADATGAVCGSGGTNFNGADGGKCNAADAGVACYDVTP